MTFENWIRNILNTEQPDDNITAYYFGVFETEEGYTLYLIGSSKYDESDEDWACNIDFEPMDKYLQLPDDYKNLDWQDVQNKVVSLLQSFINSELFRGSFMSKATAIATGFDDGDLIRIK